MKTKNYFRVAGCWLLPLSLAACLQLAPTEVPNSLPYVGSPGISGTVVDSYGRPVAGALVWVRWMTFVAGTHSSHDHCQHLDVVETDQNGRYTTLPWRRDNPPWAFHQPSPIAEVYAPGYDRGRRQSRKEGPYNVRTPDVVLPPWSGTLEDRWETLEVLARQSLCLDSADKETTSGTLKVYARIIQELEGMPDAGTRMRSGTKTLSIKVLRDFMKKLESGKW